ncbi:MAG: RNA polymerase sigma factor [Planctomycetota bacterium]|jgi:RNA polymerase sigma-70 factor (ECF subfamily)
METASLVRRAQAGDRTSRDALARTWLPTVYAVALAHRGRPAEAEDLTQEAFYRAFRALRTLRDPERFGPWMIRIVRNAARDQARRPRPPAPLGERAGDVPGSPGSDPAGGDDVVRAWQRLPEQERLVCWLKVVDGIPFRQIADLLSASKSSVDRTYRRALARLRKELSRC